MLRCKNGSPTPLQACSDLRFIQPKATVTGGFLFSRKHPVKTLFDHFFKKPSIKAVALNDLETAQHSLLKEQAAAEYHAKMTEYYQGIVVRLTTFAKTE
jgi:hypothetical protein